MGLKPKFAYKINDGFKTLKLNYILMHDFIFLLNMILGFKLIGIAYLI